MLGILLFVIGVAALFFSSIVATLAIIIVLAARKFDEKENSDEL